MAYQYLSFAAAGSILSERLQDLNGIYFSQPNQLLQCLVESLRFFQSLTGSYKQKITFAASPNVNYYDLPNLPTATYPSVSAIAYTVTTVEVVNNVMAALLEPPWTPGSAWTGTGQFTLDQIVNALQYRLHRFLGDTGCVVQPQTIQAPGPTIDLIPIPDSVLDIRRCAWISPSGGPTWAELIQQWQNSDLSWISGTLAYPLGRVDEWAQQAYFPASPQSPGLPSVYSVYGMPPTNIRVIPPPLNNGLLDCLFVQGGTQFNTMQSALIGIPDDLTPALKWGVLADVLSSDGPSRDYARADYCEQRYREFVQAAALYPSVLTADINGVTAGLGSVFDLDFYFPQWQQQIGSPSYIGMCGRNLVCLPTPDANGPYGVGLWMSVSAPVTNAVTNPDTTYLQVSKDQIDPILDYAQHIACFQMGGAEFEGTFRLAQNLIECARMQNGRLDAVAFYKPRMQSNSNRSELMTARILKD